MHINADILDADQYEGMFLVTILTLCLRLRCKTVCVSRHSMPALLYDMSVADVAYIYCISWSRLRWRTSCCLPETFAILDTSYLFEDRQGHCHWTTAGLRLNPCRKCLSLL